MARDRKIERTTIQFSRELQEEFSAWCEPRGRKIAPTAGAILKWFLKQEVLVQGFILAEPEVADRLADALMKMSMRARAGEITEVRRNGSGAALEATPEHRSPRPKAAQR